MAKQIADHLTVVLFIKYNMDTDKPITVVNKPHVSFIGGPIRQGRTRGIQVSWDPEISVAVITTVVYQWRRIWMILE